MTTLHQADFHSCPKNVQYAIAKHCGSFVANRLEGRYMVKLYFVYYFYVEIWKERRSQEVLYSKTFLDSSQLNPYLEFIDISELTEFD